MSGLAPATIVMIYALATTLGAVALVQLHLVVKVLIGLDVVALALALPGLARRVLGFLERAARDILGGLVNAWEWTVYGVRHAA